MKIGITERGDAGWDLSWHQILKNDTTYDGAVLITKYVTDTFIEKVMDLYNNGYPLIVHSTITGWGSTEIEPGIHDYHVQLANTQKLLMAGFLVQNLVIRVDPIWPTTGGLKRAGEVIEEAKAMKLLSVDSNTARLRVSILDEYRHVKERIKAMGHMPVYGERFFPAIPMIQDTTAMLKAAGIPFETCAEEALAGLCPELAVRCGCISEKDLLLMGLNIQQVENTYTNPQRRNGCHCLSCKFELLTMRHQCPTGCIYCYWK